MITKSLLIQGGSWNSRFVLRIFLSAKKWSWGNYFWQLACMACYIHLASSDRVWKWGKSWHNLFVSELSWDGIRYSSLSDPFRNWANWVVWLLDWMLEIRALWMFPELNSVTAHQSWPKHLHCQHTVLKSQKSACINCHGLVYRTVHMLLLVECVTVVPESIHPVGGWGGKSFSSFS